MATFFKKLILVLWRNFIIRRRHWLLTIFEIVIPVLLFIMIAALRSNMSESTDNFFPTSYFPAWDENDLTKDTQVTYSHTPLLYTPINNFTTFMIKEVAKEFNLKGKNNFCQILCIYVFYDVLFFITFYSYYYYYYYRLLLSWY